MKHWLNTHYKTLIIAAFLIPIITVAIVSISHVTKWYGISNPISWSLYLSVGIEIAALSALAAISANMGKKVYFPFAIVTLIQFIGNIFFAYSYIDINSQLFKDWVDLVSPLVSFMGVESGDFVGHKRFLALFAGGMLPIISLSFLHMLVKFTEEDRLNEEKGIDAIIDDGGISDYIEKQKNETNPEDLKNFVDETSRLHLSENDIKKLEDVLLNPPLPNEELKTAAENYNQRTSILSDEEILAMANEIQMKKVFDRMKKIEEIREAEHGPILPEDEPVGALANSGPRERELYEKFMESLEEDEIEPSVIPQNASDMMITTNEDIINSIPPDDEISDWDVTLMDGLEDETPFIMENNSQNDDNSGKDFTNEEVLTDIVENISPALSDEEIMEMNQEEYERRLEMENEEDYLISQENNYTPTEEEEIQNQEQITPIEKPIDNQPEIETSSNSEEEKKNL